MPIVGIGTTSPSNNLHVYSTTIFGGLSVDGNNNPAINLNSGGTNKGYIGMATGGNAFSPGSVNGDLVIRATNNLLISPGNGGLTAMYFTSAGKVGIGTTAPTTKLQVAGEISPSTDNTYTLGDATLRFSALYAVNGAIQTSDRREKTKIEASDLGLNFINSLNPVSYYWKNGDRDLHYGLIAQDTEKAIQQAKSQSGSQVQDGEHVIVDHDPKSDRYGLRYTELLSPVIKAIQELYQSLTATQTEFAALKAENIQLKTNEVAQARDIASIKIQNEKLKQENVATQKEMSELKDRLDRIEKMFKPN